MFVTFVFISREVLTGPYYLLAQAYLDRWLYLRAQYSSCPFFISELQGTFLSFALAHILTTIFVVIRGKLYKVFFIQRDIKNEIQLMVRYSIPMIPNGMTWSAVNFIDRYAILIVCGASTAGLFTAAGKLPAVINMISMIAQQSLQFCCQRN